MRRCSAGWNQGLCNRGPWSLLTQPCEALRRQLSMKQEEALVRHQMCVRLDLGLPCLQNREKSMSVVHKSPRLQCYYSHADGLGHIRWV